MFQLVKLCKSAGICTTLLRCSEQNLVWKFHTWEAVAMTARELVQLTWCKHIRSSQEKAKVHNLVSLSFKFLLKSLKIKLWCNLRQIINHFMKKDTHLYDYMMLKLVFVLCWYNNIHVVTCQNVVPTAKITSLHTVWLLPLHYSMFSML